MAPAFGSLSVPKMVIRFTSTRDSKIVVDTLNLRCDTLPMMNTTQSDARREQLLRELASDLRDLVQAGEMTDEQANEWFNMKADQWK